MRKHSGIFVFCMLFTVWYQVFLCARYPRAPAGASFGFARPSAPIGAHRTRQGYFGGLCKRSPCLNSSLMHSAPGAPVAPARPDLAVLARSPCSASAAALPPWALLRTCDEFQEKTEREFFYVARAGVRGDADRKDGARVLAIMISLYSRFLLKNIGVYVILFLPYVKGMFI